MRLSLPRLAAAVLAGVIWGLIPAAAPLGAPVALATTSTPATPASCAIGRETIAGLADPAAGEETRLAAAFAPGAVIHGSATQPDLDAPAWIAQRAAERAAIGNAQTTVNALLIDGDSAIAVWTVTGDAPPEGGSASGASGPPAPRRWTGADLYRLDCGRIAGAWTLQERIDDPAVMPLAIPPARSCADPAPTHAAAAEAAEAALRVWLIDGWSRGDLPAVNAVLDPDVAYHSVPYSDTNGPQGVDDAITGTRAMFPDITNDPEPAVIDGEWAGARWTAIGTNTGGDDPTGRPATWTGIDVMRLECGRVVEIWSVEDTAAVEAQLGLGP